MSAFRTLGRALAFFVVVLSLFVACSKGKPSLAVGTSVAAPWGGGMYLGTVKGVSGGKAKVLYADDKVEREVPIADLEVLEKRSWAVGDHVLAVWSAGRFYDGTITAAKGDAYTVTWTDGSTPSDVEAGKIMKAAGPAPTVAARSAVVASATVAASSAAIAAPTSSPGGISAGATVGAPWGGGMYLGTVQSVSDANAKVLYADDKIVRDVPITDLRVVLIRPWNVGDKVMAVWSAGRFYDGTVTAVNGAKYTVAWTDGSAPSEVEAGKILPPSSKVVVGATVAAPWQSGMYLGTVKTLTGTTAKVLYADDKVERDVSVAQLRVVAVRTWKVGDKVSAVWSSGRFYDGTVTAAKGEKYTIKWNDGSAPSEVEATKIMEPVAPQ